MNICVAFLLLVLPLIALRGEEAEKVHFTDSWAVHIEHGSDIVANGIAEKHGFLNIGQVIFFENAL